jgi:hypothetical protein
MAFLAGWNSRIWFDGLASTGYIESIDADGNIHPIDVTTLLNQAKTFIPGLEDSKIKMKGFFDTDSVNPTTTFDYWLFSRKRTVYPVTFLPGGGSTLGDPAYILYGLMTSYTIDSIVKDAVSLKTEFTTSRGLLEGKVLFPNTAESTSNAGSSALDNGAASTDGGSAALQVSAVSGTSSPSLTVKLQHSTDNSSWSDVSGGSFGAVTGVDGVFIEFTGTVNRYLRVVSTITGSSPSFTYNVAVHRN